VRVGLFPWFPSRSLGIRNKVKTIMNDLGNPLEKPLEELFSQLNILNGLLFHLKGQLNTFKKSFNEMVQASGRELSSIFTGSSLAIRDLTEFPAHGWAVYYPTGKFKSRGEENIRIADELLERESAWTISQGYEAFETFLKDMTSHYLHRNNQEADSKKLKKKGPSLAKQQLAPADLEYWRTFTRLAYRNNMDLIGYLRKLGPEIHDAEKYNNRVIDLFEWYSLAGEVRHAVTHSNMIIKNERMSSWDEGKLKLLNQFFPGNSTDAGYALKICRDNAESNLVLFSEYGFAVFKSLSKAKNYYWNILKNRGSQNPK
jgi:hypothetical protein